MRSDVHVYSDVSFGCPRSDKHDGKRCFSLCSIRPGITLLTFPPQRGSCTFCVAGCVCGVWEDKGLRGGTFPLRPLAGMYFFDAALQYGEPPVDTSIETDEWDVDQARTAASRMEQYGRQNDKARDQDTYDINWAAVDWFCYHFLVKHLEFSRHVDRCLNSAQRFGSQLGKWSPNRLIPVINKFFVLYLYIYISHVSTSDMTRYHMIYLGSLWMLASL